MWTQINQENGASQKFYMVLIAMQFGTIWGKKIRIKSFLQPFRRREGSSFANILFPQSLVRTTGVLQHQGLMERADGAIRSRWTLILVNVQKLANNYPALCSTGSNHKSNLKQREKMIFVICKHQLPFPKIFFKKIFVGHLLEKHEVHLIVVVDVFSVKFA